MRDYHLYTNSLMCILKEAYMKSAQNTSLFIVIFLGLLTAITPLATDLYLPALPIMPGELNTNASLI